ncbi:MAG TPA: molybdopterin molybdotransferase MoeA, partial [Pirellulaceae bacterium]
MISLREAQELVALHARPLGTEAISPVGANHRRLAHPIISPSDAPRFDKAVMDGFALSCQGQVAQAGQEFDVLGTVAAGESGNRRLDPGEAMRIMTGAPLPPGTDTVVPWEQTENLGNLSAENPRMRLKRAVAPGSYLLRRGQVVAAGDQVLSQGTRITPARLALLIELGCRSIEVFREPRIAVLTTGNELREIGGTVAEAAIFNTNGPMLEALVHDDGYAVTSLGIARDDRPEL